MAFSRRQFLQASGTALLCSNLSLAFQGQVGSGKKVLVIGGGPAGLCAAYELSQAGCDVQVFEARPFAGGRIMTLRQPFSDGLYVEAGALYLSTKVVEGYVAEFELPLVSADFSWFSGAAVHIHGEFVEQLPDGHTKWPVELPENERGLSRMDLWRRYRYGPIGELAGTLDASDFPYPSLAQYDQMSLADFFRSKGASEEAVNLMSIGFLEQVGEGTESYSALSSIAESAMFRQNPGSKGAFKIKGGNDLLPKAFAERLGSSVHFNSPVVGINQRPSGVELTVETGSGREQVKGDYAVCAAPFPVLRELPVLAGLSDRRRDAFNEIDVTSVTRIFLQFSEQFWTAANRSPAAWTDLPIQSVLPSTLELAGPRGILESFSGGAKARHFQGLPDEDAIELALRELVKVHPEARDFFEVASVVKWDDEPWIKGCQAYFKPGQMSEYFPFIAEPEGRIYFAGDHIGGVPGYTHSALLSAQTAASDILFLD